MTRWTVLVAAASLAAGGCSSGSKEGPDAGAPSATPQMTAAPVPTGPHAHVAPPVREGGTIARGAGESALYVADEDHKAVRRVPVPLAPGGLGQTVEMPGAPGQVLALDGKVLVTIRDPGLLLVMKPDAAKGLVETARVELPIDAWGIAITADEKIALVTSAWSHRVSAIDLASAKKLWSVDVPREPRAVTIRTDGTAAYVSHLVGAELTKFENLATEPKLSRVMLAPSLLRTPSGTTLDASLGYAALLGPDDTRLYVARHALGALGENAWFGASTVDVLTTADDQALAPRHHGRLPFLRADKGPTGNELIVPGAALSRFTQPRAMVYRKSTKTLLVASEGDDLVAELDALAVDPSLALVKSYKVGKDYDPNIPVASTCSAPQGLALSEDEKTAWVFCHGSYDLEAIALDAFGKDGAPAATNENGAAPAEAVVLRLAEDALDKDAAFGRRIFYNATDRITSGGLACAGCHPEGRDDGHTWHEAKFNTKDGSNINFVGVLEDLPEEEHVKGVPRRTPILAGRVTANGPYGWHAESPDLPSRIGASFGLHRWGGIPKHEPANIEARAGRLMLFVRRGLVKPPKEARELDAVEQRGRQIFTSEPAGCMKCHVPDSEYTDRTAYPLPKLAVVPGFDAEEKAEFKTPSLFSVGGHAPYFHDGSAATLERLVEGNNDRMGKTNQLSKEDRAALVAFLRTL